MVYSINITKGSRNTCAGASGVLKPVNGANGIPISIAPGFPDLQDQFNQMGIKDIRLHDCFGIADVDDGFVANRSTNQDQLVPNIPTESQSKAKTFIADFANKRTIYPYAAAGMRTNNITLASKDANFEPTDSYLKRILDNDASVNPNNIQREVFFRIGRTLDGGWEMPENFDIYATLVGNIVRRYAINYQAVGLPRKITYWEIWNEPDLTVFWNNNVASNYYEFYSKIVNVIKSIDPSAKVGGSAVAACYNPGGVYLDGFLNYCRTSSTPIDFLSWHYYGNLTGDPQNILDVGNSIQNTLTKYGYGNLESICSEWNSTPFSSAYSFSRVQSAQNAAYISSVLMYMQYCKTDRAHYYRADASSFGLFNDNPQPNNTAYKSFCSYAGQSFGLFSKLLDETPYILNQTNDFTTGLTTLAAENAAGNKINILAANYKVDLDFTLAKTPPTVAYQQYYLDANRTTNQLTDDWSKNEWFGGKDPSTITYDNTVTQDPAVDNTPQYGADGELTARPRDYTQSNSGAGLTISNIASNYKGYTITAYRIKEGGRLDRMTPEEVTSSISTSMSNGTLSITDTGATVSTVTLYSIDFTTDGNDNGNCDDPVSISYTVNVPENVCFPLTLLLPKDYIFVKTHTSYKLEMSVPSTAIRNCPTGTGMAGAMHTCSSNAPIQYSYDPSTSSFIPFKNNVLRTAISGSTYIYLPKTQLVKCNLTGQAGTLVPQVYADASNNDGKTYYNPNCNSGDPVSISYMVNVYTANASYALSAFLPPDYIFLYTNISYKLEIPVPSTAIYTCPDGTALSDPIGRCTSDTPIQFTYDHSTSSFVPFRNGRLFSAVAGRTYIRLPKAQLVKCTLTAPPGTLVPAEYS